MQTLFLLGIAIKTSDEQGKKRNGMRKPERLICQRGNNHSKYSHVFHVPKRPPTADDKEVACKPTFGLDFLQGIAMEEMQVTWKKCRVAVFYLIGRLVTGISSRIRIVFLSFHSPLSFISRRGRTGRASLVWVNCISIKSDARASRSWLEWLRNKYTNKNKKWVLNIT